MSKPVVMKVSDTLYAVDLGNSFLEVQNTGTKEANGQVYEKYQVRSNTGALNGYFEAKLGHDPVEFIAGIAQIYSAQQENKRTGGDRHIEDEFPG